MLARARADSAFALLLFQQSLALRARVRRWVGRREGIDRGFLDRVHPLVALARFARGVLEFLLARFGHVSSPWPSFLGPIAKTAVRPRAAVSTGIATSRSAARHATQGTCASRSARWNRRRASSRTSRDSPDPAGSAAPR